MENNGKKVLSDIKKHGFYIIKEYLGQNYRIYVCFGIVSKYEIPKNIYHSLKNLCVIKEVVNNENIFIYNK